MTYLLAALLTFAAAWTETDVKPPPPAPFVDTPAPESGQAQLHKPRTYASIASLEWRKYDDGDRTQVMLWDRSFGRAGREVGCYTFADHCYQRLDETGHFLPTCERPPIPPPLGVYQLEEPPAPPLFRPQSYAPPVRYYSTPAACST